MLLLLLIADMPTGITVPWHPYLATFGTNAVMSVISILFWVILRSRGHAVRPSQLFLDVLGLMTILYVTWFVCRLRWYEVFG